MWFGGVRLYVYVQREVRNVLMACSRGLVVIWNVWEHYTLGLGQELRGSEHTKSMMVLISHGYRLLGPGCGRLSVGSSAWFQGQRQHARESFGTRSRS